MKKILLLIFIFFIGINNCFASVDTASSYVLMDATTGRVLDGKNENTPMLIASITKIMTAILAIESNRLDEVVMIDETILKAYGSCIYIQVGEKLTLKDLLYGLMLRSGNDAALMIAKYVSGSEELFVFKMNEKAKEIGMTNTIFYNPSGLDEENENYSTSYDMALLTRYAMKNDKYKEIVKTKEYTVKSNYKTYVWKNKNKLLKYDYITGGKTGYTEKAKRTLVSTGSYDNINLIVVTIRDSDDWNTHTSLYKYAFDNYTGYKVLNKNTFDIIGKTKYNGQFYIKEDVYIPLLKNEKGKLISKIKLKDKKYYQNNDNIGNIEIYIDDKLLYKDNIYIKKGKEEKKNIFTRIGNLFK